ncbi:hypothetical protein ENBRE01_0552 [Enteropsectra breve]|nr:hypothetical protein ENBRE01_0552 [Enteropsectra breve]
MEAVYIVLICLGVLIALIGLFMILTKNSAATSNSPTNTGSLNTENLNASGSNSATSLPNGISFDSKTLNTPCCIPVPEVPLTEAPTDPYEQQYVDPGHTVYYMQNLNTFYPLIGQTSDYVVIPRAIKCSLASAFQMLNKSRETEEDSSAYLKENCAYYSKQNVAFFHQLIEMFLSLEQIDVMLEPSNPAYEDTDQDAVFSTLFTELVKRGLFNEMSEDARYYFTLLYNFVFFESTHQDNLCLVERLADGIFNATRTLNEIAKEQFDLSCNWTSRCTTNGNTTVRQHRVDADEAHPVIISFNKGTPVSDLWRSVQSRDSDINPDGTDICMQCQKSGAGCTSTLDTFDVGSAVVFRYVFSEEIGTVSDPPMKILMNSKNKVLILKSILLRPTEHYDGYLTVIFKNLSTFEFFLFDGKEYYDIEDWDNQEFLNILATNSEYLSYDFPMYTMGRPKEWEQQKQTV